MRSAIYAINSIMMSILILVTFAALWGCENYLVFTTSTKFGIDVSQQGNQPPKMLVGYKRAELAVIPAVKENASNTNDTYSVLGNFCAHYDPSLYAWWSAMKGESNIPDSLQIRSLFLTGMAARDAAIDPAIQNFFTKAVRDRSRTGASEKQCF
jgi:hypothetical protein